MRKTVAFLLSAAMVFSLAACGSKETAESQTATETVTETEQKETESGSQENKEGGFTPGTYEGTAKGFGGEIQAKVVVSADKIESIEVTGDSETEGIGTIALENLPEVMMESQTPYVDAVSSATVTSNAVIQAVASALENAGADLNALKSKKGSENTTAKTEETVDTDLIIVGAGGAGMTAAITAKQAGLEVVLVEKMPMVGGNTLKATGGMNAAETSVQKELGIEDSVETFVEDTMKGGYEKNNKELVTVMAEKSGEAIDWLASIGAPLSEVSFSGGATNKRIHRPEGGAGVGAYLVNAFKENVDQLGIPVYLDTKATELIEENGAVTGVKAEGKDKVYTFRGKAVILATGGFGANEELYAKYRPDLKGYVTTNTPGATGDGIVMAEAVGANLVDIDQIQTHPTVEQSTSIMITESVRGGGAILVNKSGKRFTNEMQTRDVVSKAIVEQEDSYSYIIFDQNLRDNLSAIEKYVENNIVVQADTIEGLAEQIQVDPAALSQTLEVWNTAVVNKKDAEFNRETGMDADLTKAPYYAVKVAPGVHHTMGGVEINTSAQVISTEGDAIPGLFAAGEITGGVHGGNRIGGNAVADIVVFGRIAGNSAVEYCK